MTDTVIRGDEHVRQAVLGELDGLSDVDKVTRSAQLIELLMRDLAVRLADERGLAVLRLHEGVKAVDDGPGREPLADYEISELVNMLGSKVRKLIDRGRAARRTREQASAL